MSVAVTIRLDPRRRHLRPVVSPVAELGSALHVVTAPDHHLALQSWATRVRATFTPRMDAEFAAFQFLWDSYRATFLLPRVPSSEAADAAVPTLAEELAALSDLPVEEFRAQALQPLMSRPDLPVEAAPTDSSDRLLVHARARSRRVEATTNALLERPRQVRERLVEFLVTCDRTFFADEWSGMVPTLGRAAADLRMVRDERGPAAVLVGLAHGIHARGDVVTIDKSVTATIDLTGDADLLLVPSLLCHPHVLVQWDPAWPYAIQYPVQRRAPGPSPPPLEVTAARLEALADPSRLELCALVAREARATQELAAMTGLTTPTVSRHLKVLRDAGLVTSTQHGHFRLHELRMDVVEGLGAALAASLLR